MNSRFRELLRNNVVDIAYYMHLHKGKGNNVAPQPIVAPSAPIDDASVQLSEDDNESTTKKKLKEGKGSLKIPLASSSLNSGTTTTTTPSSNTGLKV